MEEQWQLLTSGRLTNDQTLYRVLKALLIGSGKFSLSTFFPPEAPQILLDLLDNPHTPEVWLAACVLICHLCNVTGNSKEHLARRGVISSLSGILRASANAFMKSSTSPPTRRLLSLLVEYVTTMLLYFSLGPGICIKKLLCADVLSSLTMLIDCNMPGLFANDDSSSAVDFLQSLVTGQLFVGQSRRMSVVAASVLQARACEPAMVSSLSVYGIVNIHPLVLDLYDTSGDDDVHIVDELVKRCGENILWRGDDESEIDDIDEEAEWVDVRITHVIDSAHFWAVVGADISSLNTLQQTLTSLSGRLKPVEKPPEVGDMVYIRSDDCGWYRAKVLSVKNAGLVHVFSVDHGFTQMVDLAWVHILDGDSKVVSMRPVARMCKLMGVKLMPANKRIAESVISTLCNMTASKVFQNKVVSGEEVNAESIGRVLQHVVTCPDSRLQTMAIRCFCNMACVGSLESVIADSGILSIVIDVIKSTKENVDGGRIQLMVELLTLVRYLLYQDVNRTRFHQLHGVEVLVPLCGTIYPEVIRLSASNVLKVFIGRRTGEFGHGDCSDIENIKLHMNSNETEQSKNTQRWMNDVNLKSKSQQGGNSMASREQHSEGNAAPGRLTNSNMTLDRDSDDLTGMLKVKAVDDELMLVSSSDADFEGELDRADVVSSSSGLVNTSVATVRNLSDNSDSNLIQTSHCSTSSSVSSVDRFLPNDDKFSNRQSADYREHLERQTGTDVIVAETEHSSNCTAMKPPEDSDVTLKPQEDAGNSIHPVLTSDVTAEVDLSVSRQSACVDRTPYADLNTGPVTEDATPTVAEAECSPSASDAKTRSELVPAAATNIVVQRKQQWIGLPGHDTVYFLGDEINMVHGLSCELRADQVDDMSRDVMCRLVCGLLNAVETEGGAVYYGLTRTRDVNRCIVDGVEMTYEKRDRLRQAIDKLVVQHIAPRVGPERIGVDFHHVVDPKTGENAGTLHVVEIFAKRPPGMHQTLFTASVYGLESQSYRRRNGQTLPMSHRDIYAWTVEQTERLKQSSIQNIRKDIEELQLIRAAFTSKSSTSNMPVQS